MAKTKGPANRLDELLKRRTDLEADIEARRARRLQVLDASGEAYARGVSPNGALAKLQALDAELTVAVVALEKLDAQIGAARADVAAEELRGKCAALREQAERVLELSAEADAALDGFFEVAHRLHRAASELGFEAKALGFAVSDRFRTGACVRWRVEDAGYALLGFPRPPRGVQGRTIEEAHRAELSGLLERVEHKVNAGSEGTDGD